jgi:hypothetical protein
MRKRDIPEEIDFRSGKRGVYGARYAAGTNIVIVRRSLNARRGAPSG